MTLVFARDFASSGGGVNRDLLSYTPPPGKTQCAKPYNIDAGFVPARWSIVKTFISADQTPDMWLKQVSRTTAHELGHLMLLGHGNGQDDDANGPWDEECDGAEYGQFDLVDPQAVGNLMHGSSAWGTSLSPIPRRTGAAVSREADELRSQPSQVSPRTSRSRLCLLPRSCQGRTGSAIRP